MDPSEINTAKSSVLREGLGEKRPTISRRHNNKEVINTFYRMLEVGKCYGKK